MRMLMSFVLVLSTSTLSALAQAGVGQPPAPPVAGEATRAKVPAFSDAGRTALAAARQAAARSKGLEGPDKARALEAAAAAYDKVAADFAGEPALAAYAAMHAAEMWRQHGSHAMAEKGYALAGRLDAARYAQRALLGAADMQRRQQRLDEAFATYGKAAAVDPGSARAQDARLWQARLLHARDRLDEAIVAFQAALESADPGQETLEACNFLTLAWIDKNDLDAAARVLEHAEQHVAGLADEDPMLVERLKKNLESLAARKALQRARDKQQQVGKDAAALEAARAGK